MTKPITTLELRTIAIPPSPLLEALEQELAIVNIERRIKNDTALFLRRFHECRRVGLRLG